MLLKNKEAYLKIPVNLIIENRAEEIATYAYFMSFCSKKGFAYPSVTRAAKDLKFTPSVLTNSINNLINREYLNSDVIKGIQCYWPTNKNQRSIRLLRKTFKKFKIFSGYHLGLFIFLKKVELKGEVVSFKELREFCRLGPDKVLKILKDLEKNNFITKTKTQNHNIYKTQEQKEQKNIENLINQEVVINSIIQNLANYEIDDIEEAITINIPIRLEKRDIQALREYQVAVQNM